MVVLLAEKLGADPFFVWQAAGAVDGPFFDLSSDLFVRRLTDIVELAKGPAFFNHAVGGKWRLEIDLGGDRFFDCGSAE